MSKKASVKKKKNNETEIGEKENLNESLVQLRIVLVGFARERDWKGVECFVVEGVTLAFDL